MRLKIHFQFLVMTILVFFCCCCTQGFSQPSGKIIEQRAIASSILSRDVKYTIYLPPDYSTSERTYPVVYLLHGYSDNHTGWLQFGEINRFADKAIGDGTIPPMIIVMPDGGLSWYINSYDGREKYEDFFINEFIPAIEKIYRIKSEKTYRGIAGLSMGGYGSLNYAIKYPQLFSGVAGLSSAVFTDDEITGMGDGAWESEYSFGSVYGHGLRAKARLGKAWYANSVLQLVKQKTVDSLKMVRYWLDCGDDDFLTKGNCMLHLALTEKGVRHEFRVRDGSHTWNYWRTGITNALQFLGDSFRDQ